MHLFILDACDGSGVAWRTTASANNRVRKAFFTARNFTCQRFWVVLPNLIRFNRYVLDLRFVSITSSHSSPCSRDTLLGRLTDDRYAYVIVVCAVSCLTMYLQLYAAAVSCCSRPCVFVSLACTQLTSQVSVIP